MSTQSENKVLIGRVGMRHGVRGQLKLHSFTDPVDNIFSYSPIYVFLEGKWRTYTDAKINYSGKHLLIQFPECQDRDNASQYVNADIAIEREQLPPVDEGEVYWTDLKGLHVANKEGVEFGEVVDVFETGANDVLTVKNDDKERLVPYIDGVILSVDLDAGTILVDWDADF